ncbi:MAG: MFS transporter [Chloroflexia bacterium]
MARAFGGPASSTLLPQTVPAAVFANAATWSSSTRQLASVAGPALGGLLIARFGSAGLVYILEAVAAGTFMAMVALIRRRPVARPTEPATLQTLTAGVGFIWRTRVILASITLDLFAVLLGGATALLPVFARGVLHVGPAGLGWMRAAPSVGAMVVALGLAYLPPFKHAGRTFLGGGGLRRGDGSVQAVACFCCLSRCWCCSARSTE